MKRVKIFFMCLIMATQLMACGKGEGTEETKTTDGNESSAILEKDEKKEETKPEEEHSSEEQSDVREESSVCMLYQLADTKIDNEPEKHYEYDEQGKVLRLINYDKSDITDYEYDEKGRLVKETLSAKKSGKVKSIILYEYNEYDELIKKSECKASGVVESYTEYAYGLDGVCKESYYLDGVLGYEYVYTYEDGRVSRKTRVNYSLNDVETYWIHSYVDYEYDNTGNLIKMKDYGANEEGYTYMSSDIYEYDSEGRLAKIYRSWAVDNDKPVLQWEKTYDDCDNLIREIYYMMSGDVSFVREYIYNEIAVEK